MLHWINQLLSNPLHGLLSIFTPLAYEMIGADRSSLALRLSNCVAIEIDVLVGITMKAASPCMVPCIHVYTLQRYRCGGGGDMKRHGNQWYEAGTHRRQGIYYSCNEQYLYKPVFTEWIRLSLIFLHGYGAHCGRGVPYFSLIFTDRKGR